MARSASLPSSAPFAPEEIAALDKVIGRSSALQRSWLAGFLAGLDAADARNAPGAAPAAPPAAKPKLVILYATESGNSEALAGDARKAAQKAGFAARVLDMADADPAALRDAKNLLVIAATWGEGEPPQRAAPFMRALMADDAPKLDGVNFAVLALGDTAYAQFCETGKRLDARLADLGAARIAERVDCDLDYEEQAARFINRTLEAFAPPGDLAEDSVIHVDFHRTAGSDAPSKSAPFAAEIADLHPLTSSRSTSATFHLELDLAGSGITYEPGDSLGLIPENDPGLVASLLKATGLDGDADLAAALTTSRDITTLTAKIVKEYASLTGDATLAKLAEDDNARAAFLTGRQPIDLFETYKHKLTAEQLTTLLRPLPPRYYSIASSMRAVGEQAHLAIARLAYESAGRSRTGVASGLIADRRKPGETLPVFVKPNTRFRLPDDPHTPIVMIGAGTGIAPYRAFLQEREETGAAGKSWLIFGHRHFLHDFLYQTDIQDWLKSGTLSEIDLAFSRDQPEKRYVQHALWEKREALKAQLAEGATLYLCGDASAMARDVDATLARILGNDDADAGQAELDRLVTTGRYRKDVY